MFNVFSYPQSGNPSNCTIVSTPTHFDWSSSFIILSHQPCVYGNPKLKTEAHVTTEVHVTTVVHRCGNPVPDMADKVKGMSKLNDWCQCLRWFVINHMSWKPVLSISCPAPMEFSVDHVTTVAYKKWVLVVLNTVTRCYVNTQKDSNRQLLRRTCSGLNPGSSVSIWVDHWM